MAALRGREPAVTVAVAGVAGSGKSTLGRALACELELPMLDLDSITNPLLDRLGDGGSGHWLAAPNTSIREGRYAALRAVARDVVATAGGAVLVAPFTSEMRGGAEWAALLEAVAPTELRVLHLDGDPELLADRRASRGEARDRDRRPAGSHARPAVPHIAIEAELTPSQQLFRALRALGHRTVLAEEADIFDRRFDAILFDLDGTLVDSTASVTRSWERFAREFGVSVRALQENHGQPAETLVERLLGPDRVTTGLARIGAIEVEDADGLHPVPGARALFASVPEGQRAIVTSGNVAIASARLHAAGIPLPRALVTVEDVRRGKPDPEPYLRAAQQLGVSPTRCLVVEDAPAGIASARAAGCQVLAVLGTARPDELDGADVIVDGLDRVAIRSDSAGLGLVRTAGWGWQAAHEPPAPGTRITG